MSRLKIESTEWRDMGPTHVNGHTFAISDLHGRSDLAEPLLDHLAGIAPRGGKTKLVSCGDLIDRGPDSFGTVDLVMRQEERFDELILLCGNHEIMVLDAFWPLGIQSDPSFSPQDLSNWISWGGSSILREAAGGKGSMSSGRFRKIVIERLGPYLERVALRAEPHHLAGDLMFIHAGVVPDREFQNCLKLKPQDHVPHREHWAWTVEPFHEWVGGWEEPNRVIVHGHVICTPDREMSADELADCTDSLMPYKRFCLDVGGYEAGRLAALEVYENQYRFHFVMEDK